MDTEDIIPENFDLEKARRAQSTTDRDKRNSCPYCGSVGLRPNNHLREGGVKESAEYYCPRCQTPVKEDKVISNRE